MRVRLEDLFVAYILLLFIGLLITFTYLFLCLQKSWLESRLEVLARVQAGVLARILALMLVYLVLDGIFTYLQETLGSREKPLQKTREEGGKNRETWVGSKPKTSTTFDPTRPKKNNKR